MGRDISFAGRIIIGTPDILADNIEALAVEGGIDCIQALFADYLKELEAFYDEIMPLLARRELI